MYIDKELKNDVKYKFVKGNKHYVVHVAYKDVVIAELMIPVRIYESDMEAAQRYIYSVVRSFKKMVAPNS